MKIIVTGSFGKISKLLVQNLVILGHDVSLISSDRAKKTAIESAGVNALIGDLADSGFLTESFQGADAVYLMIPTLLFKEGDIYDYWIKLGKIYAETVMKSGVKRVVYLSSIGAHKNTDNGFLRYHYQVECLLKNLPESVSVKVLRPVGFYNNLFTYINSIKIHGEIRSSYSSVLKEPWVSTQDIADAAAEELCTADTCRTIRYVASDEMKSNETALLLGSSIGIPGLKWNTVPSGILEKEMIASGMNPLAVSGLLNMNAAIGNGTLYEDYISNRPPNYGKIKMKDFAKIFASVYKNG